MVYILVSSYDFENHCTISERQVNSHSNLYINTLPCWDLNQEPAMDLSLKQMAYQIAPLKKFNLVSVIIMG